VKEKKIKANAPAIVKILIVFIICILRF